MIKCSKMSREIPKTTITNNSIMAEKSLNRSMLQNTKQRAGKVGGRCDGTFGNSYSQFGVWFGGSLMCISGVLWSIICPVRVASCASCAVFLTGVVRVHANEVAGTPYTAVLLL